MVQLLLENNAQIDVIDAEGKSPVDIAELHKTQYFRKKRRLKARTYDKIIELLR